VPRRRSLGDAIDEALRFDPPVTNSGRIARRDMEICGGRHFCLGSHLAKVEAQEALRALYARLGPLKLGPGGYERAAVPSFRGFVRLEVEPIGA
jgi:cytochrome P450